MAYVISICGVKNSGKTALITGLLRILSSEGYKVAVIKHDGHDFECDIPGTDTYRFTESGAYAAACVSANRMFIHRIGTGETAEDLIQMFPEADITLIEGLKDSDLPKIEVVRSEISDKPVSNPEGRLLIATDFPQDHFDEKQADMNDIDAIAKIITDKLHLQT